MKNLFKKITKPSKETSILYLIILFALLLRLFGVHFGLPYHYHNDESMIVEKSINFFSGDLNPHSFNFPGSTIMYLLFSLYCIYFSLGWLFGIFHNISSFLSLYAADPTSFYLIGRITIVFFGAFTAIPTYLITKKLFNKNAGLIAALFMAVSPLHVANSQVIKTDVVVTFLILFSLFFSLLIYEKRELKYYVLAGVFAGCGIATKYTAIIAILPIIIAHSLSEGKSIYEQMKLSLRKWQIFMLLALMGILIISFIFFYIIAINYFSMAGYFTYGQTMGNPSGEINYWSISLLALLAIILGIRFIKPIKTLIINLVTDKKVIIALCSVIVTFLICSPFFFLDFGSVLRDLAYETSLIEPGVEPLSGLQRGLWYINGSSLKQNLGGMHMVLLAGLGMIYALLKRRKEDWIAFSFILIFFLLVMAFPRQLERRILTLAPLLLCFAAAFVVILVDKFAEFVKKVPLSKNAILALISVLLIIGPSYEVIHNDYLLTQKDTRTYSNEWIEKIIPPGTKIVREYPYTPEVSNKLYKVKKVKYLSDNPLEYYTKEGFEYLIVSKKYLLFFSQPDMYPEQIKFYNTLFLKAELVRKFEPDPRYIPGPPIWIYKLKH
ncbi:MAG: glycosyltransferase family 39 protein [Candidatus Saganbacteria bacterium]|nr:glycosyltransferase family 39 protein [Candidatus Saganbacteria bacterium]